MRKSVLVAIFIIVAGCATVEMQSPTPAGSGAPVVMSAPPPPKSVEAMPAPVIVGSAPPMAKASKEDVLLYREYMYTSRPMIDDSHNVVIFPKKPVSKKEIAQYTTICELWKSSYPELKSYGNTSGFQIVPFYWMLTKRVGNENCTDLIANYDYARAQKLTANLKLKRTYVYLLYIAPKSKVTMNLTEIYDENDLTKAMNIWISHMSNIPPGEKEINPINMAIATKTILGYLGDLVSMK